MEVSTRTQAGIVGDAPVVIEVYAVACGLPSGTVADASSITATRKLASHHLPLVGFVALKAEAEIIGGDGGSRYGEICARCIAACVAYARVSILPYAECHKGCGGVVVEYDATNQVYLLVLLPASRPKAVV